MTSAVPEDTLTKAAIHNSVPTAHPRSSAKNGAATASYLAHDTRNWLTVLQVYCDLLRTPGAVASGHQDWIEELSGAVERGQGLITSLLDSVQEASQESMRDGLEAPRPASATVAATPLLDPGDVLARRRQIYQRVAGDKIHVELDTASNAGKIAIEESAFSRVLYNLVGNAIDAMPEGGSLRITLRPGSRSGSHPRQADGSSQASMPKTVMLRVCDTGEGIAPERLPFIFDAGVSSKPIREDRQPRGFGLAIVRELTDQAGGTVRVRSHAGRGSCFELEFPQA